MDGMVMKRKAIAVKKGENETLFKAFKKSTVKKLKGNEARKLFTQKKTKKVRTRLTKITIIDLFENTGQASEKLQIYEFCWKHIPEFDYFAISGPSDYVDMTKQSGSRTYNTRLSDIKTYLENLTESRVIYIVGHGSKFKGNVTKFDGNQECSRIPFQLKDSPLSVVCYDAPTVQRNGKAVNLWEDPYYLCLSRLKPAVKHLFVIEMCYSGLFLPKGTRPKLQLFFSKDKDARQLNGSPLKDAINHRQSPDYFSYGDLRIADSIYQEVQESPLTMDSDEEYKYPDSEGGKSKRSKYARRRAVGVSNNNRHAGTKRFQRR
jgi:hypothetical protein